MNTQPPPADTDAERAVLSAMLLDDAAIDAVAEHLSASDYYEQSHSILHAAICALHDANKPVDQLTLANYLRQQNQLDAVGGILQIARISAEVASASRAVQHAEIVVSKARLRRLVEMGSRLHKAAYSGSVPPETLAAEQVDHLSVLLMGATQGGLSPIEGAVSRALERIEQASASGHHMTGVRTGIPRLDQLTGGWQKKDLIILAARPSMGKTALALDFARAAAYAGTTVAFFSLEMSSESLAQRTMSQVSGINLRRLRTGELNDAEWDTLSQSVGKVALLPIHIDDQGGTDMAHLRTQCRRLKATSKLGLVIIDYLQLINSSRHQSIEQEVAELSRGLKGMARELDVPVIVLSQLSRDCEKRPDRRPMLSDLRYSGAIEQDADIVMFLYRPQVYGISTVEVFGRQRSSEGVAELLLSKQRNGPTATVALHWSAQATTFSELAEDMETTYV